MVRVVINTKQKIAYRHYEYKGSLILFSKTKGYAFSDHPNMDEVVEYFLAQDGFKLVGKEEPKKEKKEEFKPEPAKEVKETKKVSKTKSKKEE